MQGRQSWALEQIRDRGPRTLTARRRPRRWASYARGLTLIRSAPPPIDTGSGVVAMPLLDSTPRREDAERFSDSLDPTA